MSQKIALDLLDLRPESSVCGGVINQPGRAMDRTATEQAITSILAEIHARTRDATRIARAAEACANAGSIDDAVTISMEIEQILYEAGRLQDAASLLNRISKT